MIGTLLDRRYQVVRVLGQGGFGCTYVVQDTRRPGNPNCVVKHLQPTISDPDFLTTARRLFTREAEILEQLGHHDRIPCLLAYFEEEGEFYLIQEFVPGSTLASEMQLGVKWSEAMVVEMLQEVLSILKFVHSHQVIHQDIKPHNLIRRSVDNKLVLVDFGAVKQVKMYSCMTPEQLKNDTVPIGTPGYMPLEQAQGRPRPCSDIYALGMLAIQALTGLNPKQLGEEPITGELVWQHHTQVSEPLATIISKMVYQYCKHRYQSADEVLRALASITNPKTTAVIANLVSQRLHQYLQDGYVSATKIMRSLQELAQRNQIYLGKIYLSGTTSQPNTQSHLTLPPQEETVTVAPRNAFQYARNYVGNINWKREKLPLLMMVGSTVFIFTVIIINVLRSPQAPKVTSQNQVQEAREPVKQRQTQEKNDCVVVVRSSNLRSLSGRRKTGTVVKAGTRVTVTGKQESGWIEIRSPEPGWIWKSRTKNSCPKN